jgi:hypothetical protein
MAVATTVLSIEARNRLSIIAAVMVMRRRPVIIDPLSLRIEKSIAYRFRITKAAGAHWQDLARLLLQLALTLLDDDRLERAPLNAHEAAAAQHLVDVRQFMCFKLDERFQPAGLTRHALATSPAFVGIHARNSIIHADQIASRKVVGS